MADYAELFGDSGNKDEDFFGFVIDDDIDDVQGYDLTLTIFN